MSEVIERPAESTAVAIIPTAQLPTLMAAPETRDILDKLLAELEGFEADGSTPAGRKAARSKAGKVSTAKQDLLRLTAHLKEGALKQHRAIVAEEKIVESRFNELRDKIKKPADDYEAMEEARVKAHEDALTEVADWVNLPDDWTANQIAAFIEQLDANPLLTRQWQEFHPRAQTAVAASVSTLRRMLATAEKREAEAAELERLRAEAADRARQEAARQQAEREAEIARQAAETARVAAEEAAAAALAKAEREKQEAEERAHNLAVAANEEAKRAEAEKQRADAKCRQLLLDAINWMSERPAINPDWEIDHKISHLYSTASRLNEVLGECEWGDLTAEANTAHDEAFARVNALKDKLVAQKEAIEEGRRNAAAEAAATAERARAQREQAELERQAELRADNEAHRAQFNREAALDLQQRILLPDGHSLPKELAKAIVVAVARGQIRHIAISY